MKRRFVAICLTVISLLTSCGKAKLRSDIIEFIASFSIDLAVENYPSASYRRALPFSSNTFLPVTLLPSRFGRPFSRTSKAMALARRVEVVLRL